MAKSVAVYRAPIYFFPRHGASSIGGNDTAMPASHILVQILGVGLLLRRLGRQEFYYRNLVQAETITLLFEKLAQVLFGFEEVVFSCSEASEFLNLGQGQRFPSNGEYAEDPLVNRWPSRQVAHITRYGVFDL